MDAVNRKIFLALPAMNEREYISACLESVFSQTFKNFQIVVCVNQPEDYWVTKPEICENNAATIQYLEHLSRPQITLIDKSSKGKGWLQGKSGIGYARKTLMDYISGISSMDDIIISMDADTTFKKDYFDSVIHIFNSEKITALANPYYHKLNNDESANKAILRYEIYMRNYLINMLLINSPYAFSALGSALAVKVSDYKSIGGITPKKSGEDFYFLQKLRKFGRVYIHNDLKVFPAARFSDRVFFGTGPAMIKGRDGDWESYPIYHFSLFQQIQKTYSLFPALFKNNCPTPIDNFISIQFGEADIWSALRNNNKDLPHFIKACHDKIDGLRILQYLKNTQTTLSKSDEQCLTENCIYFQQFYNFKLPANFSSFNNLTTNELNSIRNELYNFEEILRKKFKTV